MKAIGRLFRRLADRYDPDGAPFTIRRMTLHDGDCVVITSARPITSAEADGLKRAWRAAHPNIEALVLGNGLDIPVVLECQ